jgi:hypothetical protein
MTFRSIAATAALAAAALAPHATGTTVPVTLNGVQYQITTLVGTPEDFAAYFAQQPWYLSTSLAQSAADQVGASFGLPNNVNGPAGPAFVLNYLAPPSNSAAAFVGTAVPFPFTAGVTPGRTYTFAFDAATVPAPGTAALLGVAGFAASRRRRG